MERLPPSRETTRRSAATAVWALLLMGMSLVPGRLPIPLGVMLVLAVSLASSFALVLSLRSSRQPVSHSANWALAVFVPQIVAVMVTWHLSDQALLTASLAGLAPFLGLWMILAHLDEGLTERSGHSQVSLRTARSRPSRSASMSADPANCDETPMPATVVFPQSGTVPNDAAVDEAEEPPQVAADDARLSENVTQWQTRSIAGEEEVVEGGMLVEFPLGQRETTVHISFCPPLLAVPRVDVEELTDRGLEIRVAAAFSFGARLIVRRTAAEARDGALECPGNYRIAFFAAARHQRKAA